MRIYGMHTTMSVSKKEITLKMKNICVLYSYVCTLINNIKKHGIIEL